MLGRIKDPKGFTLLELMIVVAIIGILAAIAIPNFLNFKDKATRGTVTSNCETIRAALNAYAADDEANSFPDGALNGQGWTQIITALPFANLPGNMNNAKIRAVAAITMTSEDYTLVVTAMDARGTTFEIHPSGTRQQ